MVAWFLFAALLINPTICQHVGVGRSLSDDGSVPDYITRHAPLVWLHSEDPFRPADILSHIHHTKPATKHQFIPDVPELDLDNLAILNDFGGSDARVALSTTDNVTSFPPWLFGETPDDAGQMHNATPCVVVLVEKGGEEEVDAFYFYFYSFDRGANITQVREPLNRLLDDKTEGLHFGNHVGDWEHNMVRFRNGVPTGIYYSQHEDGAAYSWDAPGLAIQDDRPVVYSAYGSHANYASPGNHIHDSALFDYCDAGQLWDPISSAYIYRFNPSDSTISPLSPSSPTSSNTTSNMTSFFYYTGLWGDEQYEDDDPRQLTVPYFGLKRYVSGPTGPATKQLVRKGLFPDHRSKKPFLKWAVGVFMAVYPVLFRGWRLWVTAVVTAVLLALFVFATRYTIARYRTRGYHKVDAGIPMNELGYRTSGEEEARQL